MGTIIMLEAKKHYRPDEQRRVARERRRIQKRQSIGDGWDGSSSTMRWPLAELLARDGNMDLLPIAATYARLHEQANSNAVLGGTAVGYMDGFELDRQMYLRPDGRITYGVPKTSTTPENRYLSKPDNRFKTAQRVPKPWNGDAAVNRAMDARQYLSRLQSMLGPLCEPFEMACIDGQTMEAVGGALGIGNKAGRIGAGKAVVHMALVSLRDMVPTRMIELTFEDDE